MAMTKAAAARTRISTGSRSRGVGAASTTTSPLPTVPSPRYLSVNHASGGLRVPRARGGYGVHMAEFEAERRMPAEADAVFAIVGDLDRLPEWMPAPIGVRPTGDGEGHPAVGSPHGHADVESRDVHADGLVGVRPEQLRVEWGSDASPDYAGWLQVEHAEEGHSSVLMHLSFLGDQPEARRHGSAADEVRQWLDDALSRL